MYPREFPPRRRRMPKRRAEQQVYKALASSHRRGFVYYEWRKGYGCPELDFGVWIADLGRFALQVKGGRYRLIDGEWRLLTREGSKEVRSCPLDETWLATLDLHDDIEELAETAYNPYVVPVLVFPDMEPDSAIEQLAKRKGVYVVWGADDILDDLEHIVWSRRVFVGLPMERIAHEVWAVTDGQIRLGRPDGVEPRGVDPQTATASNYEEPVAVRVAVADKTLITVRSRNVRCRVGN